MHHGPTRRLIQRKPPIKRWWHYTVGTTFRQIVAEGRIRRTAVGLAPGERPAVWSSRRETWEPTATKGIAIGTTIRGMTVAEMVERCGALIRIEVDPSNALLHTWAEHRRIGGIDRQAADALEAAAAVDGADPREWRVSYEDIPVRAILTVEASDNGDAWTPMDVSWDDRIRRAEVKAALAKGRPRDLVAWLQARGLRRRVGSNE